MKRYPLYVFDLDGTLFRGDEAIVGAVDTVAELVQSGSAVRYSTNNSTQLRETYVAKLRKMGFPAEAGWVYSSALAAAEYLRGHVSSAFVVGEHGLVDALQEAGIQVGDQDEAVVVGLCRHFDYALMTRAMQRLLNPEIRFIATNRDASYPMEGASLIPGSGAIVASLATCSGREPEVIGKPNPFMIEWILREAGVVPSEALVVGDRFDTDIVAGQRAGCDVHMVLSGVTPTAPDGVPFSPTVTALLD